MPQSGAAAQGREAAQSKGATCGLKKVKASKTDQKRALFCTKLPEICVFSSYFFAISHRRNGPTGRTTDARVVRIARENERKSRALCLSLILTSENGRATRATIGSAAMVRSRPPPINSTIRRGRVCGNGQTRSGGRQTAVRSGLVDSGGQMLGQIFGGLVDRNSG